MRAIVLLPFLFLLSSCSYRETQEACFLLYSVVSDHLERMPYMRGNGTSYEELEFFHLWKQNLIEPVERFKSFCLWLGCAEDMELRDEMLSLAASIDSFSNNALGSETLESASEDYTEFVKLSEVERKMTLTSEGE